MGLYDDAALNEWAKIAGIRADFFVKPLKTKLCV